jgi:hypothetical protein
LEIATLYAQVAPVAHNGRTSGGYGKNKMALLAVIVVASIVVGLFVLR